MLIFTDPPSPESVCLYTRENVDIFGRPPSMHIKKTVIYSSVHEIHIKNINVID